MRAVEIILAKRNGRTLDQSEIAFMVQGYTRGEIPDYQIAAWLMAICWRGMLAEETAALTLEMVRSGAHLNLAQATGLPFVGDKHSTGGVGDKTTLVVAPAVAAAGLPIGKMSGRGLGFSGGTIDKLEAIPGFKVSLSQGEFIRSVREVGLVVVAQSPDLAPADGKLYALRDVTGTVESLPLIASSIMSKKIAAGASGCVLDVKYGRGAFMKDLTASRALATTMVEIGRQVGLPVRAVLSGMEQPLGYAVGNGLEVQEAIATLRGGGPDDLWQVSRELGRELLLLAGLAAEAGAAEAMLDEARHSGAALAKLRAMVANQGGDVGYIDDPSRFPAAPVQQPLIASMGGYLVAVDAEALGHASVSLGAGRLVKGAEIDHRVGFVLHKKVGDWVAAGDPLLTIHAANEQAAAAVSPALQAAYQFGPEPVTPPPLSNGVIS